MAINYLSIIGEFYPTTQAHCVGDPGVYNDISWTDPAISQAELDGVHLAKVKTDKILEFADFARQDITIGFMSDALGYPHEYDSEAEDQLNLIGAVATEVTMPYSCRPYANGYQIINMGDIAVGTDSTGFSNDTTTHNAEVVIDGTSSYLSIQGQDAQTIDQLLTEINADVDFTALAIASLENGNIKIESKSYGSTSTISIVDTDLFGSLTGYVSIDTAADGLDPSELTKVYKSHTHAELLGVLNDGKDVKLTILQKFNVKKAQILAAVDEPAIDAIVWE